MSNSNTVEIEFTTTGSSRAIADSGKVGGAVKDIGGSAGSAAAGTSLLNSNLVTMGSAAVLSGIVALGASTAKIVGDLYNVNVEFGKLNAQLVTITGSQAGADAAFARLEEFATKTPFQLNEVVNAFAKLKARGLDPSQEALTSYGDIASGMSKSLDQMIEAVGDAATGEFERLKEFGITARSEGDKASFTFKGITTTVAKEASAIEGYLVKLGQTNFAGGMNRQMEELGGSASNLGDSWDKLMRTIGDVGATTSAQVSMGILTESLEGWSILIHDTNEEIESAAEWMAAYSVGQVSFWEWMTTGADEARIKLRALKDEMDGFDKTGMLPSHDPAGSAERTAKIIAQAEKDAQTKARAQAEAEKKAQKEFDQLLKDNPVQKSWSEIDQTGMNEANALIDQTAIERRLELSAILREMELADISFRVQMYADGEAERMKALEKSAQYEKSVRQDILMNAVTLFKTLGVNQKAAAIAGIAINKGIALSAAYTSTASGAQLAWASQLVPGDPTSLARAAAASAFTWKMGALNMALIAASGFAEAANAAKGSNPAGGGFSGGMGSSAVTPAPAAMTEKQEERPSRIINIAFHGYTNAANPPELARLIAAELRIAEEDGY